MDIMDTESHLQTLRDRQAASFAAAQARYDSAEPPEPDDREPDPGPSAEEWASAPEWLWDDDPEVD